MQWMFVHCLLWMRSGISSLDFFSKCLTIYCSTVYRRCVIMLLITHNIVVSTSDKFCLQLHWCEMSMRCVSDILLLFIIIFPLSHTQRRTCWSNGVKCRMFLLIFLWLQTMSNFYFPGCFRYNFIPLIIHLYDLIRIRIVSTR